MTSGQSGRCTPRAGEIQLASPDATRQHEGSMLAAKGWRAVAVACSLQLRQLPNPRRLAIETCSGFEMARASVQASAHRSDTIDSFAGSPEMNSAA